MALMKHDGPGTVELCCSAEVDVGDDHVEEGCEMMVACLACHEVVTSRD